MSQAWTPVSAGYSGKPLVQKLGIKKDAVVVFVNAPENYEQLLGGLPDGVTVTRGLKESADLVQLFATERAKLVREVPKWKATLKQGGMLWVSWPKRSSKLPTDLTDAVVRDVGLK